MSRPPTSQWIVEALERHERALLRYAAWAVGDLDAARELVQETFLRLCKEDRSRVEGHVAQWLFTVCRNLAFDARRKAGRMTPLENAEIAVAPDLDERHDADHARPHPGHRRDAAQESARGHLPEVPGGPQLQIAEITHLSVSNVGFLIHTAVRTIRTQMQAEPDRRLRRLS